MAGYTGAPGPTEVASWQKQIVKPGATVSQTNANAIGANPAAIELYNMPKEIRKQIAVALKNAGYRVPTSGVYSQSLVAAFSQASMAAQTQAQMLGMPYDSNSLSAFLAQEAAAKKTTGAGATKITKQQYQTKYRPEDIEGTIQKVFQDLLGRDASKEELGKYISTISSMAAKPKNMGVSEYVDVSPGVQRQVTTPAFDPQAYLIKQIAGTDEAKARKVISYYDIFDQFVGRR